MSSDSNWGTTLAYAFLYDACLPYLRTLVWGVSLIGVVMIFSPPF